MTSSDSAAAPAVRHPPKQFRSHATIAKIETATRRALQDPGVGRDRFTTAQVAELAGVSIGTIYRYFPDRVALLDFVWPDRGDVTLPSDAV